MTLHHVVRPFLLAALLTIPTLLAACGGTNFITEGEPDGGGGPLTEAGQAWPEAGFGTCAKGADADKDGIPDDVEGCGSPARDTDKDGIPDYADTDSDNDAVLDKVEGKKDTDGDKIPDYRDEDSDADGVKDGDEDLNGDGLLGCCLSKCGESRPGCPTVKSGECGPGQTCEGGACKPAAEFLCANGETDAKKATTFTGGKADKDLPTFICRKRAETSYQGLKPINFHKSTTGTWKLALEKDSSYGEVTIAGAGANEAGATFDLPGATQAVAGFIVSLPTSSNDVGAISSKMITDLTSRLQGKASVSQVSSGSTVTSHDGYATVVSTQLAVQPSSAMNPPAVRDLVLGALVGKTLSKLPPATFGPSGTELVLRMQTLLRKDGRYLVMGAVAATPMAQESKNSTGFHLDDLSNGTGLATLADSDTVECDPFILTGTPIADIIWIVDESGSMDDNRKDIVANAADFFARAVKSGLDFRMAVAGMKSPAGGLWGGGPKVEVGKFCGKQMPAKSQYATTEDDGGPDRFLQPNEEAIFKSCVENPPYEEGGSEYGLAHTYEAVARHLPRKAGDPSKIRPEATVVIIVATDEVPQEFKSGTSYKSRSGFLEYSDYSQCTLTAAKQQKAADYVQAWVNLFTGKDAQFGAEAKAMVHLIGGLCNSTGCDKEKPEMAHGYLDLVKATGGTTADICQKNLGATLQAIIDSVTGAASPAILQYKPISASIAVAMDLNMIPRSRVQGFDYVGASNSLVFVGVSVPKGSQIVASYRRWVKQASIDK